MRAIAAGRQFFTVVADTSARTEKRKCLICFAWELGVFDLTGAQRAAAGVGVNKVRFSSTK